MRAKISTAQVPFSLNFDEGSHVDCKELDLVVKIEASAINYHDLGVFRGRKKVKDQLVPLSDAAGTVLEVGSGVTDFRVGDKVITRFFPRWISGPPTKQSLFGVPGDQQDGFAEHVVTRPATAFTRAPKTLSVIEAATLPCAGLTAWRALFHNSNLHPGSWIVTQGSGGVSIFAIQFAKAAGLNVISTSSSDDKLKVLKELGADVTINYSDSPEWGKIVQEVTGGVGADHIVDVGGGETLAQSITACRVGGRIAVIGVLGGYEGKLPVAALLGKNITMQGLSVGNRDHQNDMVDAVDAHGIKPVVDRTFPLKELESAFSYFEEQRHIGKVCISY